MMERLAAPPPVANAEVFTRSASVSATGRVTIVSQSLAGPLVCTLVFGYFDDNTSIFHMETKAAPMTVSGRIGTCDVVAPFKWQNVTDTTNNMEIIMVVGNVRTPFAASTAAAPALSRLSAFAGPSLPLPLEGEDVHFNFDIRI
jgi:hypothetical protein